MVGPFSVSVCVDAVAFFLAREGYIGGGVAIPQMVHYMASRKDRSGGVMIAPCHDYHQYIGIGFIGTKRLICVSIVSIFEFFSIEYVAANGSVCGFIS